VTGPAVLAVSPSALPVTVAKVVQAALSALVWMR
jgi:hypothetical protein